MNVLPAKPAVCRRAYERLRAVFGPQHWWPARTRPEIVIGAVLTQNTAWSNVARAIASLRAARALSFAAIADMPHERLARLIRPAGYFNLKARRLRAVVGYFVARCKGRLERLAGIETSALRDELLAVYGVGHETADSILLYALERPVFVVDAYTLRIGARHGWFPETTKYEEARAFFERSLTRAYGADPARLVAVYNEFHALLVRAGALYCKPTPRCADCPLAPPTTRTPATPRRKPRATAAASA